MRSLRITKQAQQKTNGISWISVFFLTVALVVLFQVVKGFVNTFRLLRLAKEKETEVIYTYAKAASLKNRLDRITSGAYREEFLKENLDYFEPGEMLIILEGDPKQYVRLQTEQSTQPDPLKSWIKLFVEGRSSLEKRK